MLLGCAFIVRDVDLRCCRFERPIPALAQALRARVTGPCARLDDAHGPENRAATREIPKLKELAKRAMVEIARPRSKRLQTSDLGSECENSIVEEEIKRLDSDSITYQHK